eukprot:m51a1_g9269 hypothetical protein (268) ;mRNA; r:82644-83670
MDALHFFIDPLVRTRNWEDDEEDADVSPASPPSLAWASGEGPSLSSCASPAVLVGTRGAGATFLRCAYPASRVVAAATLPPLPRRDAEAVEHCLGRPLGEADPAAPAVLMCRPADAQSPVVVVSQGPVDPARARQLAAALLSVLPRSDVVVLDSMASSAYRSPDCEYARPPALRRVCTEAAAKGAGAVPFLESPNLVQGLAAAVVLECQWASRAATAFVTLQEASGPDATAVKAFESAAPSAGKREPAVYARALGALPWLRQSTLYA